MSHVRGDVRKHGDEADVCENCRPLLDALTAERDGARERVDYVTQLNIEKAQHVRELQARLAEVADVAEQRGEKCAALTEQIDRVTALADEWAGHVLPPEAGHLVDALRAALDGAA